MKFSIITPTHNDKQGLMRAVSSVKNQSYDDWELIVVDDASNYDVERYIKTVSLVKHDHNQQRVVARNNGMKTAVGEWICWLDSDDYYLPYYLEVLNEAIEKYPDAKVFNFGGVVVWNNWASQIRTSRHFDKGEIFKSGKIMSGGFIFKRECLEKTGYLPEKTDPYSFGIAMKDKFRELEQLYPGKNDLGNPWGDDWAMFYMLTRHYQPKLLDIAPYVVMIRGDKQL